MLDIILWFIVAALKVAALFIGLGVFFTILTDGVGGLGRVLNIIGLRLKLSMLRHKRKLSMQLEIEKELERLKKDHKAVEQELKEEVKSEEPEETAGDPVT